MQFGSAAKGKKAQKNLWLAFDPQVARDAGEQARRNSNLRLWNDLAGKCQEPDVRKVSWLLKWVK